MLDHDAMTNHELHPLCTLFPRLAGAEFEALREDIKANGLRQPIVLHDGMIIDGGNRYRACLEAGVEPRFSEFEGGNLVAFVLSANLHRRHMTPGQQAAIVASAQDWVQAQPAHRPAKECNVAPLSTAADRAAQSGASLRTQKMADKVAKADPELAKKVAHGEVSLPKAVEQIAPRAKVESRQIEQAAPDADELAEAHHTITELALENERLQDRLAVEAMDASEDEKLAASEIIGELRARVVTLEAEVEALKVSRDTYMREASEAKKSAIYWRKQAEKAGTAA